MIVQLGLPLKPVEIPVIDTVDIANPAGVRKIRIWFRQSDSHNIWIDDVSCVRV